MSKKCKHNWVADNAILCSDPPQVREICYNCGEKRQIVIKTCPRPSLPTYQEIEAMYEQREQKK